MFRAFFMAVERKFLSRMPRFFLNRFPSTRKSITQSFFPADQVGIHGLLFPKIVSLHVYDGREIGQFCELRRNFSRKLLALPFQDFWSMKNHMNIPCKVFSFSNLSQQDF